MASIFCDWRSCSSSCLRSVTSCESANTHGSPPTEKVSSDMRRSSGSPDLRTRRTSTSRTGRPPADDGVDRVAAPAVLPQAEPRRRCGRSPPRALKPVAATKRSLTSTKVSSDSRVTVMQAGLTVEDLGEALLRQAQRLVGARGDRSDRARSPSTARAAVVGHGDAARLGPAHRAVAAEEADGARRRRLLASRAPCACAPRTTSRSSGCTSSRTWSRQMHLDARGSRGSATNAGLASTTMAVGARR